MSATTPRIPGRGPAGSLALQTYLISGASGSFRAEVPRPDSRACSVPFPLLSALGLILPPGSPWFFLWLLSHSLLSLLLPWVTAGFHPEPRLLLLPRSCRASSPTPFPLRLPREPPCHSTATAGEATAGHSGPVATLSGCASSLPVHRGPGHTHTGGPTP